MHSTGRCYIISIVLNQQTNVYNYLIRFTIKITESKILYLQLGKVARRVKSFNTGMLILNKQLTIFLTFEEI